MKPAMVAPPFCRMWLDTTAPAAEQGHGDGLAEGPAQAQHRATDDAAAAVGQHDRADHPPPGAAQGQRRLLLARRRLGEDLAAIEATMGMTMSETTMPAMKIEPVRLARCRS